MDTKRFKILSGPNRDRLIDAFKYAYDDTANIPVSFAISMRQLSEHHFVEMRVDDFRIVNIQHEDGSGNSFNIAGYCQASLVDVYVGHGSVKPIMVPCRFEACYNTATRNGTIEFSAC